MTWNYRIIRHADWIGLHEVYYDDGGRPKSYTTNAATFVCDLDEGPDGIIKSLEMALADARKHPVLTEADFNGDEGEG